MTEGLLQLTGHLLQLSSCQRDKCYYNLTKTMSNLVSKL